MLIHVTKASASKWKPSKCNKVNKADQEEGQEEHAKEVANANAVEGFGQKKQVIEWLHITEHSA
ncbi:hypothetical protein FRC11_014059 [Ceratobasidium sp. 423]|nr:hypothetical protein FRC11_014059 [Ceratobasidium sp. 423]